MRRLQPFPYKKVLVLGLAKSGTATAQLLLRNEIAFVVNDYNTKEDDPIVQELREKGAQVVVGSHPLSLLDDIDLIVKNPGIPYKNALLTEAVERKIPIVTEIELAYILAKDNPLIGITGSNGKTTTTTLVEQMLRASEQPVKLAGNIGYVASEVAETLEDEDAFLLELSSFQLMGTETFRPHIAALLNLFAAHLDYHDSREEYDTAKKNVFIHQNESDFLVYNQDDERVIKVVQDAKATLVPFSVKEQCIEGAYLLDESLYYKNEKIIDKKDIVLVGEHNIANILAAIAISKLSHATNDGIRQVLTTFSGVEHRLQFVGKHGNRLFYNDSKATNILATEKALQAFQRPTILLAGGLHRGDDFDQLIPYMNHVKAIVLFGETKHELKETAEKVNIPHIHLVKDVTEATKVAFDISEAEDVILLSPACASWDQYKTFEERGNMFIQTMHTLA